MKKRKKSGLCNFHFADLVFFIRSIVDKHAFVCRNIIYALFNQPKFSQILMQQCHSCIASSWITFRTVKYCNS